uniref:Uncharacterized protein n=1 Tax=Ciona savignyi TaxID=51511 RepID=H2YG21_CIOSA
MGRRQMSVGVDVSEPSLVHRSLTPPPSFERAPNITPEKAQNNHHETNHGQHSVSRSSLDSKDPNIPIRNWIRNKWEPIRVKPTRGWGESSLDDSIETGSTTSRSSGTNPDDPSLQQRKSNHADPSRVPTKPGLKQKPPSSESLHSSSANSNQNNHNLRRSSSRDAAFDPTKLKRDVSDSALSELSIKSNPVRSNSMDADIKFKDERRIDNLPKIQELSPPSTDHFRKRSSSFTESPSHHVLLTNRKTGNKNQFLRAKGANKGHDLTGNYPTQLGERTSPANAGEKGQSGPGLQPAMFDTNLNIRMYLTRSSGHLSLATPSSHQTTAAGMGHPQPTSAESLYPQHTANIARNNQPSNYSTMHARYPVDNVRIIPANHANNEYLQAVHIPSYQQYLLNQHAAYQQQQHTHMEPGMTTAQRDILNNEVYQDIGMGWVPPLHEYGSRASVVESANAQYKK